MRQIPFDEKRFQKIKELGMAGSKDLLMIIEEMYALKEENQQLKQAMKRCKEEAILEYMFS